MGSFDWRLKNTFFIGDSGRGGIFYQCDLKHSGFCREDI
jgi:hypothetical protein